MSAVPVTRRHFLKVTAAAGGGLLIGFHIPEALAATVQPKPWTAPPQGAEINAWLAIDAEGNVTIRVPHTEMGQGALTAVSMMIAEELDVDWTRVRAVFADPNRHLRNGNEYKSMNTSGSAVVRRQHPHIMQAGASARERLKEAAARAWGVERSTVEAKRGTLKAGTRAGTYAEFATAAAAITLSEEPAIKKPGEWWLLGKPLKRLDVDVKSNGSATYAIDVQVPNMVYAAVKACPVPWGTLKSYDDSGIRNRPGILAVVALKAVAGKTDNSDLQDAVAVVADSWWRAKNALEEITIEWDYGPYAHASTASQLTVARQLLEKPGELVSEKSEGTLWVGESREVTAEYHRPWETHARMEPINATVSVTPERVDVWSPTQDQSDALEFAADQAGMDPAKVFVHTVFLGGAFGGNGGGATAVTRQATEISKRLKRPVKVIWSREEDIAQDKQRPPNVTRLTAALRADGLPYAWTTRSLWFTPEDVERVGPATADYAISNMPYQVPNRRHERINAKAHIPVATHRAPGTNQHGFMTECFVDEVAIAGGIDPLEWRLRMTAGPRRLAAGPAHAQGEVRLPHRLAEGAGHGRRHRRGPRLDLRRLRDRAREPGRGARRREGRDRHRQRPRDQPAQRRRAARRAACAGSSRTPGWAASSCARAASSTPTSIAIRYCACRRCPKSRCISRSRAVASGAALASLPARRLRRQSPTRSTTRPASGSGRRRSRITT